MLPARTILPGTTAPISGHIADIPTSRIGDVAAVGRGDPDVIPLWFGEGDLPTPRFICDAAERAMHAGETFYTWQRGIPELRAAIARYTAALYGIDCAAERITVTGSGMQAIILTCQALIDPGDNIVIVSPVWPNIVSALSIVRGISKPVLLERKDGVNWSLDLDRLFDAVDERTRAIFVNSPSNPTGWTMPSAQQKAILDFARRRGIWVMADEVYARIVYNAPHAPSFLEYATADDPLIVLQSFSKPWAMTGWRLGWMTSPHSFGEEIAKLLQFNLSGSPAFLQRGAVAAIEQGDAFVKTMVERCRAGGELVFQRLSALPQVRVARPEAAFYAFFSVDGIDDSLAFAKKLVTDYRVGIAPGVAFGPGGEGNFRLCFASGTERLSTAMDRIEAGIRAAVDGASRAA
jgi:aspartate/methionine/tyrosine aminotransferase